MLFTVLLPFLSTLPLFPLTQGQSNSPPIRWMPLGDSITDYGCWRAWIWRRFLSDGLKVDLVGGERAGESCDGLDFDRDHEGHPGFQAVDIFNKGLLKEWLDKNPADIVTVHLGTVDILRGGWPAGEVLRALEGLVGVMREKNTGMRVIMAQIIPLPAKDKEVQEYNAAIPGWAAALNTSESPVWVVDQWHGFEPEVDLYDGIHPAASGDVKIAERFYPFLVRAVESLRG